MDHTLKTCPKCGAAFKCYNKGKKSCWCENYSLSSETLQLLRSKWDNCLCEECLKDFSEKNSAKTIAS
ncbi:hypothetical protein EYV94_11220 [Puteibacter caeruleilacunae]|nr:hypothetical protein EYV94_11220 [Puteibacter caeruleilacunae]